MRILLGFHPSLDALSDYRRATHTPHATTTRDPVARHVARCARCQASLVFLDSLDQRVAQLPSHDASAQLRQRILDTRADGTRAIVPLVNDGTSSARTVARPASRSKWIGISAAAGLTAIAVIGSLMAGAPTVEAAAVAGTMQLSNDTPQRGERVTVRYRAGSTLSGYNLLNLRARVRTREAREYATGIPVVTLATLRKERDGTFSASFVLPDSIVFAALAVEDSVATEIDDHGGRTWTVRRAAAAKQPTLSAIEQHFYDLMGKNWEGVFTQARSLVQIYPDSIAAWSLLQSSHSWMGWSVDSVRSFHRAKVAHFDRTLRAQTHPSGDDMGRLSWYARNVDSTVAAYWKARAIATAPTNEYAVQARMSASMRTFWTDNDTTAVLRAMDNLWSDANADRRRQILSYILEVALPTGDTAIIRRWTDRQLHAGLSGGSGSVSSTVRAMASEFVKVPALRTEGLDQLRAELARLRDNKSVQRTEPRSLDETQSRYQERLDRYTRSVLAALGRGLVLAGQPRQALDTLALATAAGWNIDVFRDVRTASLSAGDTARAITMAARLVVDPRTNLGRADTLATRSAAIVGESAWQRLVAQERQEMVRRILEVSRPRSLSKPMTLIALDGSTTDLSTLSKGHVTIVAFWSRHCGPAIMALPELQRVAERMAKVGVRTLMVVDESQRSPELQTFLQENRVTLPVYLDAKKLASQAFNQWGTPEFFVLDQDGRMVFPSTSDTDVLLVRAEAVRLAAVGSARAEAELRQKP